MSAKSAESAAEARVANLSNDPVRNFYTDHPYPPPLADLDKARELWQDENIHRAEYHLLWPDKEYRADFNVLIAGCGTWQAAKFALTHPAARVVGIDISPTSLEHTEALKKKYEMTNLETRELSLENVGQLEQEFDLIVSTGVIHHLADPDAGLRALRSILRPDGAMYLMLYASYGRTGVTMLQEYCRRLGVGTSQEEINQLAVSLQYLPQHHPLMATMRGSRDEMTADFLVDALLNPRDRTYSVTQVYDFLERNDLKLGRWYWQAAYLPQCGLMATTPHAPMISALPEREQYAQMELWRGLMTNHDFIAYRNDSEKQGTEVSFDDDSFLRYVPIRRAWTMIITERLPPGAAAVLINQTHLFPDLFIPVDLKEVMIYQAIDGRHSIAELLAIRNEEPDSPLGRAFFQKLWQYDQVVFDTSKAQ